MTGKESAKELSVYFFHVAHRAKQLSKGHKLSNLSIYRCKQRLQHVYDIDNGGEVDESFVGARLSWPNSFVFPQSGSTNGDERYFSFRAIETSGNNWINVKREDKSVGPYRGPDLSKRGSYGEGVKNMLWSTAGKRRRSIRGEQRGEEGEE